jgi:endoglucanase
MEIHWRALGADDNLQEPELLGKQFAEMYKLLATRYSRSNYLMGFCTFSEIHLLPCRYNDYNQIRKVIIDAVHKVDRLYIISLTGTWWSSPGSLNDKIYIDRPNIIYDFHFYSPKYFTHRGKNVDSLKYPGKMPIGWFRAKQSVDISYLEEQLKPALDFSKKWNVPVWCGEFGAFNNTSDNSTERWYQDVIMLFEQNTIPWIMWRWMPEAMDICESWKRYWQAPVL